MTVDRQGSTRVVRRDVATLSVLGSATLPDRPPDSWPHLTDNRGFRCTSPDGDVAFLVSASGYGNGPADNVVVWVDGETTTMHPVDEAFAFAVAPDLSSAYLITGDGGTMVEVITLADGTRRPFAELPAGVGGRVLGVDHATGRLAVIATSNPAATNRGDPAAPDDRLIVLDSRAALAARRWTGRASSTASAGSTATGSSSSTRSRPRTSRSSGSTAPSTPPSSPMPKCGRVRSVATAYTSARPTASSRPRSTAVTHDRSR